MNKVWRVFVDSNVLYSAARLSGTAKLPSGFERYWSLRDVEILTSWYSIEEVSRSLESPEHRSRLWRLIYRSHLVPNGEEIVLPATLLPEKDVPIPQAAIAGGADLLITGDRRHFSRYDCHTFFGVEIISPTAFESRYPDVFPVQEPRL